MQNNQEKHHRKLLPQSQRIVVKVGTRILVDKFGKPNPKRIATIANQLAKLHKQNKQVVLVTSGAIGAGLEALKIKQRPTALQDLQMAASIGQVRLMNYYTKHFAKYNCLVSQVLLTHSDLNQRERHLNVRNTILNLLHHQVIPIINENDAVSCDEIKIGDNDVLSALVATLIGADLLILITSPDGLRKTLANGKTTRIPYITKVDNAALKLVTGEKDMLSTGGMGSKLQAAQIAAKAGSLVVIASGKQQGVINRVVAGEDKGTLLGDKSTLDDLSKRKRWIAYFHKAKGAVTVDVGAENALCKLGKSLLPIGIKSISGDFTSGSLVKIKNSQGDYLGCGLAEYSKSEVEKIKGKTSAEIADILGYKNSDEFIHRDNMVIEHEHR